MDIDSKQGHLAQENL